MFFSLFLTGAVIEFSQVGAGFIDGLVISRCLGPEAMAAEGIVHPIYSILGVISGMLAVGMQVCCAQAIGRGSRKEYCRLVSSTVYVGAALSLLVTGLVLVFAGPFAVLLGASGNAAGLAGSAAKYLTGIGIGIPSLIMTVILASALQLDTGRKTIQTGALIEAAANILLDLLAVKLDLGIFGIGLATAAASYLDLLYQCTFFLRKDRVLHFVRPDVPAREFFRMLAHGWEKATRRLANTLRPIVLNAIIISTGGVAAMSALSVRNNFANFAEIIPSGIAAAVSLLIGVYYGEINEEAIREVGSYGHRMIALFSGVICAAMLVFAPQIAGLYVTGEGETLKMTTFAIRMLALQNPLQALILSRIKYLQAVHRKFNVNLLTVGTQVFFVLLSAFVLSRLFGVYGILACYTVSDMLTLLVTYLCYAVTSRKMMPSVMDYLNLPEEFHLNPGDVISLDIRDREDVSLGSEQIMLFCRGHQADRRVSYYAALSFEELALNIVEHGFKRSKSSEPMIDLRAVISGDMFVIRMRDNCPEYDITKKIAAVNEDGSDPEKNIGIRIISRIASDIIYLQTFDTNTTIIQFRLSGSEDGDPAENKPC